MLKYVAHLVLWQLSSTLTGNQNESISLLWSLCADGWWYTQATRDVAVWTLFAWKTLDTVGSIFRSTPPTNDNNFIFEILLLHLSFGRLDRNYMTTVYEKLEHLKAIPDIWFTRKRLTICGTSSGSLFPLFWFGRFFKKINILYFDILPPKDFLFLWRA